MLIEETVIAHLSGLLPVPVYAEVPDGAAPGDAFAVVEKTGGRARDQIHEATFAVQSYGATLRDCAALSRRARRAMETLPERDEIGACRFETEYNWTDTAARRYRYQAVFHLTYYEEEE